MGSCEYCGESINQLAYECNYCEAFYCQAHRLPEAHNCPDTSDARPPTSAAREADAFNDQTRGAESPQDLDLHELRKRAKAEAENQPYSVVEVEETVGTTPEPDFASSPDVAVDGSVQNAGSQPRKTNKSGKPAVSGRWMMFLGLLGLLAAIALFIVFLT